ncbi:MAG: hypothetical protein JNG88_05845 [Phycisphaerales bacterium]|nr:hypothetical protein [Phycisphaerales bacterium]
MSKKPVHAKRESSIRDQAHKANVLFVMIASGLALFGCAGGPAEVQLTGFQDPLFPDRHRVTFPHWTYRADAGGDIHITARAENVKLNPAALNEPPATHSIHMHLVWTPQPGHTPAPTSGIDATIRYLVETPRGHTLYVGTAFVYFEKQSFGDGIKVALERSELRRAERGGNFDPNLSPLRMVAELTAELAPNRTVTVQRDMDRVWSEVAQR